MRRFLYALCAPAILLLSASGGWANSPPVISNVSAFQRPDKLVQIRYDLTDADGDLCTVGLAASNDGGATWSITATALTGAVGSGVGPGAAKVILWDSKIDLPGVVGSQFKVRVCADDGFARPPQISVPIVTGIASEGEVSNIQFSCNATVSSGSIRSVTVNLSNLGGSSAQPLTRSTGDRWQGSASVTPPTSGQVSVSFTAITSVGGSGSAQAFLEVAPPGMVCVPAGQFQMGDPFTVEGDTNERPRHTVYVNKFFIARHEVTAAQYADALNWARSQGGLIAVTTGIVYQHGSGVLYPYCSTTAASPSSRITWNGSQFGVVAGKEDHPMTDVSWYGAAAYANWQSVRAGHQVAYDTATWTCNWGSGYRLPTEAEWEKAARGGATGRRFPWTDVDTIDFGRANYYSSAAPFYDLEDTASYHPDFSASGYPYTSPAGHFSANPYGLYDMAGNVWEWCNDWYDPAYYAVSPSSNPRGPAIGVNRSLRGGSWGSIALNQRCAFRSNGVPTYRGMLNGFRLAMGGN